VKKLNNTQLALVCIVIAVLAVVWTAGVASNAFGSSAFSMFWWLSRTDAYSAVIIVAPSLIGATVILGEYFLLNRKEVNA
jgi:hypothetical protein